MDSRVTNRQKIYEDINDLFQSIVRKKNSGDLEKFFDFLKSSPHQAPFNNALVFAQRPECVYYMTADQWEAIHGQKIKAGCRPMVILYPFGPVSFVYDYESTEGPYTFDRNTCLEWWFEKQNSHLSLNTFSKTTRHIEQKYQIPLVDKEPDEFLRRHTLSTGGYAWYTDGHLEITLHPRYFPVSNSNATEAYGVLVHEIAHILLGHLGLQSYYETRRGEKVKMKLCEDRSYIGDSIIELEAELTAWLVFNRFGIKKNSDDYMATWLTKTDYWQQIDFSKVLRVANIIFEMR